MKSIISNSRWLFLLLLVLGAMVCGGCATESENVSEKPWSTPQGWENGLPSGMFDQYGR